MPRFTKGARLAKELRDKTTHTSSKVWPDTAYRSQENGRFGETNGFHIHCKKPKDKPMSKGTRRSDNLKSKVSPR
jgi:hypothetical protein